MSFIKDIPNWRGYGRLIKYDKIGSTNEEGKTLARAGTPNWTILQATKQTLGRGRQGNIWVSDVGNLFMSVVLHLPLRPENAGQLSFLAGVAVARAVKLFLPENTDIQLKWPNDVLIDGLKLSGILIETETADENGNLPWVVLGVGLNVENAPDDAIALRNCNIGMLTVEDVLVNLCSTLKEELEIFEEQGFTPIRKKWMEHAYGLGEEIAVRLPNEELSGIFTDLDDNGVLLLELEDGSTREITSGEVFIK